MLVAPDAEIARRMRPSETRGCSATTSARRPPQAAEVDEVPVLENPSTLGTAHGTHDTRFAQRRAERSERAEK